MNDRLAVFSLGVAVAAQGTVMAQATTEIVSVDSSGGQGNGHSGLTDAGHGVTIGSTISGDGSVVAFASEASNLVPFDTNGKQDVFVHVRSNGLTERVSVDSSGVEGDRDSLDPSSSLDGTWIAFESAADNLVAGDTNGKFDIYVRDRSTGVTERISIDSFGNEANGDSYAASITSDGQIVAYSSVATNLVAGDSNSYSDIFVHDNSTGITERVSLDSSGSQSNGDCYSPSISTDGRFVVFSSTASNLVANDTNGFSDVFIRDRATGTTERISVTSSGSETDGNCGTGRDRSVSADGMTIAFTSDAPNLGSSPWAYNVYVHDRSNGVTELVSAIPPNFTGDRGWPNFDPSLSADGEVVAFVNESNYDVFVRDRTLGVTELISVDSSGANRGNGNDPSASADGQVISFESISSKLVPNDANGYSDVFVHERCEVVASWTNYDQGFPGTNGIPSFTARSNPVRGSSLTLDVGNSSGLYSFGLLELGYQRADIPSSWGGDLLVSPVMTLALGLSPTGTSLTGSLPHDDRLCGLVIDLQVMESDPGALKGVSFTPGLELVVGQ